MAIIYTYPQINSSSDLAASDLMIISDMSANGRPTKSLTLKDLADFVTSTGTGTGTTNAIIKWSDGPAGLLGDSIMTESDTQIDLAGTFLSTSSPTGTSGPIHGIRANQTSTATGAFNIALYGDSKHTGANKGSYNYGLYTKAEFEGTNGYDGVLYGAYTEARYDGSGTNATWSSLYGAQAKARVTATATGDLGYMIGNNVSSVMDTSTAVDVEFLQGQHTNVTFNSGNVSGSIAVNLLDFDYPGGGTLQGDFAYLQIQNDPVPTPVSGTARAINSDSTLPSHFSGDVEIPLVPTANSHATSKQYVDQQIASIPAGLVFQGNWNASTNTPTLASGTGTVGNYYVVSVAGNTNLDGITDWEVGDWAVFVEVGGVDKWDKIDQTFVQGAGATGQVSFWNGVNSVTGDNDLYWDNVNKRLGIGTATPGNKLELQVTSNGHGILFKSNATQIGSILRTAIGGTVSMTIDGAGTRPININNSSSSNVLIANGGGNVGVGTTSPAEKLEVNGNILVNKGTTNRTAYVSDDGLYISRTTVANSYTSSITADSSSSGNNLNIKARSRIDLILNGNTTLVANDLGNVGIGTDSPSQKLHVNGAVLFDGFAGGSTVGLNVGGTGNGQIRARHLEGKQSNTSSLGDLLMNYYSSGNIIIGIGGGNVGIGTANPAYKLHVDGSIKVNTGDNIFLGNANDLALEHNSGLSQITNATGDFYIQNTANDKDIIFRSDDGSGGLAEYFRLDGSVVENTFSRTTKVIDNYYIGAGSSTDLYLTHDGTNSSIINNTGDLTIQNNTNDGDIIFRSDDGSGGTATYMTIDGGVEMTTFSKDTRHNDNVRLNMGDQNDLHLRHNGTNGFITNSTGNLYITNESNNEDIIFRCDDGAGGVATYFYLDGSLTTVTPRTVFPDNSVLGFGTGADLQIYYDGTTSNIANYTNNLSIINHFNDGDIKFFSDDGSGGVTEYFRVDGGAEIVVVSKEFRFADSVPLKLGSGPDLEISHNGNNSLIRNSTGDLDIANLTDDGDIIFKCDNGSGGIIEYLRLDGSDERLTVNAPNGMLFFDDIKAKFGTGGDLQIYHDGTNSYIQDNGTGDLLVYFDNEFKVIKNGSSEVCIEATADGSVDLYHNSSQKFATTSTGTKTTGQMDLAALNTPVTNSDDNGTPGEIRFTADYIYVCVADDTWKRVALSTW